MQIGFVGTGTMGAPIARCLIAAGHRLTVYDKRPEATEALCAEGARRADHAAGVARDSEVVLTSLPGPAEVEAAVFEPQTGLLADLAAGSAYIGMTTNTPSLVRRRPETGGRAMTDPSNQMERLLLSRQIAGFLYREAELLDERRYGEWLILLAEDVRYWRPMRRNVKFGEEEREFTREGSDIAWFDEGKDALTRAVRQILTGSHWAEEPVSRISHMVSNILVLEATPSLAEAKEVTVKSGFPIHNISRRSVDLVGVGPSGKSRRDLPARMLGRRLHVCMPDRGHQTIVDVLPRDKPASPANQHSPVVALIDNPRLDRWVGFRAKGKVTVSTGKVEIGQGVLTAMLQIAAEELDVMPERITLQAGDTELTPNEGYTSGSQSIQYGGVALGLACAEVRALFLDHVAASFGYSRADLSVTDGAITCRGQATGHDYWSLAAAVDLGRHATGRVPGKAVGDYRIVGGNAPRIDLAAKIFGEPAFVHDMALDGMMHARVVRQPRPGATIASIDEGAIRRAAKGPIEILRHGNFLAVVGSDETVVEAVAAVAPNHVAWDGVDAINPAQEEARWLLQQPSIDNVYGAPLPAAPAFGASRHEATYTRMHIAHASVAPSCALAVYRDGRLQVWTHSQGVYPLRDALARTLKLDPAAISVKHVQGPGCYGHNGADDAAADAAVIAFRTPGTPVRVRWRREEEFGFEPVSPAMVTTVRAALDGAGQPSDWTTEIWSGRHSGRPGRVSGTLLAAEAMPNPPPPAPAADPPEAGGGGGTRNGEPLYAFPAKRIVHHLIAETPVRTSSLRGLGATLNVFAIESFMDELAERAGQDPVAYRLSVLSDARARAVVERVVQMSDWKAGTAPGTGSGRGIGFARYKNRAAYAAVVAEVEVDENVRLLRVWCAADAGLVVNPDGAINQLEGGIIQAASWALKEGARLDAAGISSRDWESYPVLRFSEVPEVAAELVNPTADSPPLGIGEASGGPTVAAIGNAVAHALGARLRDLPLTRDRIMAALLTA